MVAIQLNNILSIDSKDKLAALAVALGGPTISGWTDQEEAIASVLPLPSTSFVLEAREAIAKGDDLLGEVYSRLTTPEERRPLGAIYTPQIIVEAMMRWAALQLQPNRVIDPGTGSARFLVAAGRTFPNAELLAIECDPYAAILARGHLVAAGLADRSKVIVDDYRAISVPTISGRTLFIGNPPYVRHHLIGKKWKTWFVSTARKYGLEASQLAGLHAYFFLATAELARDRDVGIFITAAEWLDVNYGRIIRELLLGPLGIRNIHVIDPTAMPFPGTATTAAITGFEVGSHTKSVGLQQVTKLPDLGNLNTNWQVRRERLETANRWTPLTRAMPQKREGFVELGELCRVHRGQVTGANRVWIAGPHGADLPTSVLFRSVTKARELFAVKDVLADTSFLRCVIDLPINLEVFDNEERRSIEKFLRFAKSVGADSGFIARHRKAWWSVGLRQPAAILATYMARRPPIFVRNLADARHINIAHGLYPREPLSETVLRRLATFLSLTTTTDQGRTYAGGLTKFEPREMERILVPRPELFELGQLPEVLV